MPATRRVLALSACAALCAPSFAQGRQLPDWTRAVPADCRNIAYVGDLYPHVIALLDADPIAEIARSSGSDGEQALRSARAVVTLFRNQFPTRVVAGLSDATPASIGTALHAIDLFVMATENDMTAADPGLVDDLRRDVLACLQRPLRLDAAGHVTTRTPRVAEQWYDTVATALADSAAENGFAIVETDDSIEITIRAADLLTRDDLELYAEFVFGFDSTHDETKAIVDRVMGLSLRVFFALTDDGLRFELGTPGPLGLKSLTSHATGDDEPVAFFQWNHAPLLDGLHHAAETWDTWAETPLGKQALANDTEDYFGTSEHTVELLETMPIEGSLAVRIDDALSFSMVERAGVRTRVEPIHALADLVPPDAELVYLDGSRSLGDALKGTLLGFEERLAKNELRAGARGQDERLREYEAMSALYYQDLGTLREVVLEQSGDAFSPPFGCVLASDGVSSLRWHDDGTSTVIPDVPLPSLAVFAKPRDETKAREFLERLGASIDDVAGNAERSLDDSRVDLGLGVPTWEVPQLGRWLAGGSKPHAFFHGETLVWSTSRALSERIMADTAARDAIADVGRDCVGVLETDGQGLRDVVARAITGVETVAGMSLRRADPATDQILRAVASALTWVGRVHSRTTWRGDELITVGVVEPSEPPTAVSDPVSPDAAADDGIASVRAALHGTIRRECPAAALAVVKDGRLVFAEAVGMADRDAGVPVDEHSRFPIYELTEILSGQVAWRLHEAGVIDLDGPVPLPLRDSSGAARELRFADVLQKLDESRITGFRLCVRREALPDWPLERIVGEHLIADSRGSGLDMPFAILQHVAERETGATWEHLVQEHVGLPLGLTSLVADTRQRAPARAVTRYRVGSWAVVPDLGGWTTVPAATGAWMNVRDMGTLLTHLVDVAPRSNPRGEDTPLADRFRVLGCYAAYGDDRRIDNYGAGSGATSDVKLHATGKWGWMFVGTTGQARLTEELRDALYAFVDYTPHESSDQWNSAVGLGGAFRKPPAAELHGTWTGSIRVGGGDVPLAVELDAGGVGSVRVGGTRSSDVRSNPLLGEKMDLTFDAKFTGVHPLARLRHRLFVELNEARDRYTGTLQVENWPYCRVSFPVRLTRGE